jgi:O-antigen ligase
VTLIIHAPPIYISVERGFGTVIVELGIVGLILWVVLRLTTAISVWKVVKELRATPWFLMAFVIFLFPLLLFFPMTSLNFCVYQDFVINAYVWLLMGLLYCLRMFPKAIQLAQAEAALRQS